MKAYSKIKNTLKQEESYLINDALNNGHSLAVYEYEKELNYWMEYFNWHEELDSNPNPESFFMFIRC